MTEHRSRRLAVGMLLTVTLGLTACDDGGDGDDQGSKGAKGGKGGGGEVAYRPQALEGTEIVEAPATGIDLGWGWDGVHSEPVRTVCVELAERSEPAQTRMMTMHEVSDSYEVMQRMGMSAEASVKAVGFEVSGKAEFAKDLEITGFSSSFVLNATVDNGVRYAAPAPEGGAVRLTEEAVRLARGRDLDEFKHRCGNAFVSAVYSGAKLTALLTVHAESQAEQEKLSAELSGSGWGARMEAKVESMSTSTSSSERLDLSIFQVGGRGDAIPTSKEDLLEKLEVLSALAFDAPKDFHIAVTPYESLANWPAKTIGGEEREFDELASTWGAYNTLWDEIEAVLEAPGDYRTAGFNDDHCPDLIALGADHLARLAAAQDEVRTKLLEIEGTALGCVKDPEECTFEVGDYRSPYAYRALLPVPDGAEIGPGEVADYTVTDTAKRRCDLDLGNPGCLSNAAIAGWAEKVGLAPLVLPDEAAVEAVSGALPETFTSCAGKTFPTRSAEAGHPVLWVHPYRADAVREALAAAGIEAEGTLPAAEPAAAPATPSAE